MLKDTSQSFLAAKSDSMAVRAACRSPQHFDAALWRSVCNDMYWQGVLVPEVHEGLALGWVEMAIIMEAAGERLLTSPLFAVTQSTALLNVCLQSAVRDRCLADIASGHIVSLALTNAVGSWHASGVSVSDLGDGLTLSGEARGALAPLQGLCPSRPEFMEPTDFGAGDFCQSCLVVQLQGAVQPISLVEVAHHPELVNIAGVFQEDFSPGRFSQHPFSRGPIFPAAVLGSICRKGPQP